MGLREAGLPVCRVPDRSAQALSQQAARQVPWLDSALRCYRGKWLTLPWQNRCTVTQARLSMRGVLECRVQELSRQGAVQQT